MRRRIQYTCTCDAYSFPHRIFSGKCSPLKWVTIYWETYPFSSNCSSCNAFSSYSCEVVQGRENALQGECFQEFASFEEIKIYGKYK